jgi:maltooligosyltrehalose trehalohydrolase
LGRQTKNKHWLIAESAANDVRVIKPRARSGHGMDAQWSEDFHHSFHALITGERQGYYQDYGHMSHLVKALQEGFVYTWQFSTFRQHYFGSSSKRRPAQQLVIFIQNHDQVGNRRGGQRLNQLVDFERLKLAAGTLLLSPYVPLLFMGQEYADPAPFFYFIDHSDEALVEAVRQGRRRDCFLGDPEQVTPDPQRPESMLRSRLNWDLRNQGPHATLLNFHRHLIRLRQDLGLQVSKNGLMVRALAEQPVLMWQRPGRSGPVQCLMNFGDGPQAIDVNVCNGPWTKRLDSAAPDWDGPGVTLPAKITGHGTVTMPAHSVALYQQAHPETTQEAAAEATISRAPSHLVPNPIPEPIVPAPGG